MGAHDISFSVKGQLNDTQMQRAFNRQVSADRSYNGSRDGYSGDFQTVEGYKVASHKVFEDRNEAYEFGLDKSEKWSHVSVVFYRDSAKKSARTEKLEARVAAAYKEITETQNKIFKAMKEAKSKTIGCPDCESKINRKFLKSPRCPVCGHELRSKTAFNSIENKKIKYNDLEKKLKESIKKDNAKGEVMTLFVGWGAC